MDFEDVIRNYETLTLQLRNGKITTTEFTNQVNGLRILDNSGRWWQLDPSKGTWIFWNGSQWVPGTPRQDPANAAQKPPPAPQSSTVQTVPKPKTPQSAINKVPISQKRTDTHDASFLDFRSFLTISKTVPLNERPRTWWNLLSVLCGIVIGIVWFFYSGLSTYTGAFDILSPLVMIGLPVLFIWFRDPIDRILLPIQNGRKKIGKPFLIGLGIFIPFLTAFILSGIGVRNYPLLSLTLIIGTFCAYALMRDPEVTEIPGKSRQKTLSLLLFMLVASNAVGSLPSCEDIDSPLLKTVAFEQEEG